jgi:hypothetical protein
VSRMPRIKSPVKRQVRTLTRVRRTQADVQLADRVLLYGRRCAARRAPTGTARGSGDSGSTCEGSLRLASSALEFNGDVLLIMCTRQMAQQGGGNCRLVEGGGGFDDHVVCGRQIHHFAVRGVNTRCNNQTSRPDHCGQPLTRKNRAPRSTRVRRTPLQKLSTSWIPTDTPGSRHSIPGAVQGVPQRRAAIPTVHCM